MHPFFTWLKVVLKKQVPCWQSVSTRFSLQEVQRLVRSFIRLPQNTSLLSHWNWVEKVRRSLPKAANLKMGIKRLIWAKFLNSGQTCIAPDYVLLPKSIKEEFLRLAKAEIEQASYSIENGNYIQIVNDKKCTTLKTAH